LTSKNAAILSRVASGQAIRAAWLDALTGDLREIALAAIQVDQRDRRARLRAELLASGRVDLWDEVDQAGEDVDPDSLTEPGYTFLGMGDALKPLPPLRWVVKPILARPSVSIFFGAPKGLKTLLLLDLAISVAAGKKWLTTPTGGGGFEVTPSPVAWLDCENGLRRMSERIGSFGRGRGVSDACPFRGCRIQAPGQTYPAQRRWDG